MSIRIYFLNDNDEIISIPYSRFSRLQKDQNTVLSEYAGKTVRAVEVILENEKGKPKKILRIIYPKFEFNENGQLNQKDFDLQQRLAIDFFNEFARIEYNRLFTWNPKEFEKETVERKIRQDIFQEIE